MRSSIEHLTALALGAVLAALLGMLTLDLVVLPVITKHGRSLEVPDVTDRPLEEARKILSEKGFRVRIEEERYDPYVPKGCIISQRPEPFSKAKLGRRIYLVVSKGRPLREVVDVCGVSVRQAKLRLEQAGLRLGEMKEVPSSVPKGVVIGQAPKAGTEVPEGTRVDLIVSSGLGPKRMPDLVGMPLEEAEEVLEREGLPFRVVQVPDTTYLPGTVLRQEPEAGAKVEDEVMIWVSGLPP
ncbi:MAG: hypothetical protein DRP99_02135 [Candidatus Latescibacterota bacterium]|nr:MAG: hypothetical protein DRP99_02135 [Candidatus Latescibacterota bacterium]